MLLKEKTKNTLKKMLSIAISGSLVIAMLPEIWIPIHADMVRQNIISTIIDNEFENTSNTEIIVDDKTVSNKDPFEYVLFSGNKNEPLNLSGWKGNFTGNIYSGQDFVTYISEFMVNGRIDAVGSVFAGGWKTEISEQNEYSEIILMPDFGETIEEIAKPLENISGSSAFIQDRNVINGGIYVDENVTIDGTYFEGDCYIIAEGDITYNVMSLQSAGRVVLYSKNGNITINGSQIEIDGILYAPNGRVTFNTYDTTINGLVWADTITFNGSIFNVAGAHYDLLIPKSKGVIKTYTTNADFSEGTFDGVAISIPDQLTLAEKSTGENTPFEKIYGDLENGKGVKVSFSSDKSYVTDAGENVLINYNLSGFGDADINENAVDLIIVIDESGSMSGTRTANAKAAAKEVVSNMKDGDRCAIILRRFSGMPCHYYSYCYRDCS